MLQPFRTVVATRYVTPLREGGSLPAIVEADDLGLYVLKFAGAGQGPRALVAELLAGEIGRALGLWVPELVLVTVDAALGRNEADPEIRDLLRTSVGLNLGLDYLPGSAMFDPAARPPAPSGPPHPIVAPELASEAVWFDAYVTNVDRTARNPNLLWWHKNLYFIDHGAALYFHHNWPATQEDLATAAHSRFPAIRHHVLLPWASALEEADRRLRPRLQDLAAELFPRLLAAVPDAWLAAQPATAPPDEQRAAYVSFLQQRLEAAPRFVEEALSARELL
jgi:hypothetical protein